MGLQGTPAGKWGWTKEWLHLKYIEEKGTQIASHPNNYYLEKERQWDTQEGKTILSRKQTENLLDKMHRWTNLGDKKLIQAVKVSKVYAVDLRFLDRETVE